MGAEEEENVDICIYMLIYTLRIYFTKIEYSIITVIFSSISFTPKLYQRFSDLKTFGDQIQMSCIENSRLSFQQCFCHLCAGPRGKLPGEAQLPRNIFDNHSFHYREGVTAIYRPTVGRKNLHQLVKAPIHFMCQI